MTGATVVRLAPNLVEHFYLGGSKIAELRGIGTISPRQPEEWVAATVSRAGEGEVGLARTTDGALLRDLVAADPRGWLGDDVDAGPSRPEPGDTGLLVKLLDAGQRLPVHVHPDRDFAARHLDCPYGKTEAWYVLHSEGDGAVYLGWSEEVDPLAVQQAREAQDSDWMLGRLNRIEVRPGDGVLVPAGTPHAIGQGVFLAEVQEPTDLSILLEWSVTTSTREESHLGLGFDVAMGAVSHEQLEPAGLLAHLPLTSRADLPQRALPPEGDPFFRLDLVAPVTTCPVEAGFAALVVLDGTGALATSSGREELARGDVLAVAAGAGDWSVDGPVSVLVARPGAGWPGTLREVGA